MLEKIKNYAIMFLSTVAGILGLLYLWERRNSIISSALLKNAETNEAIRNNDRKIEDNKKDLEKEAALRSELEKQIQDNKINEEDTSNIIDFFNRRK